MIADSATIQPKPPNSVARAGSTHDPWLAAGFSFFLPGAGQALNGQFWKGVLFLVLSFVVLPVESYSLVHLGILASLVLLVPLLSPWVYSMVSAARQAAKLNRGGASFNPSKGAIYVTILLVVVFPIVALLFSTVTLLLLPLDVLTGINDWTAGFRRAIGTGA